jgi:hypothetical protein
LLAREFSSICGNSTPMQEGGWRRVAHKAKRYKLSQADPRG